MYYSNRPNQAFLVPGVISSDYPSV